MLRSGARRILRTSGDEQEIGAEASDVLDERVGVDVPRLLERGPVACRAGRERTVVRRARPRHEQDGRRPGGDQRVEVGGCRGTPGEEDDFHARWAFAFYVVRFDGESCAIPCP